VKIALFTILVTQILAVILMFQISHAGLTLATSLGACLNASLLYVAMRRAGAYTPLPGWSRFLLRIGIALAVLGAVLWLAPGDDAFWLHAGLWPKIGRLAWVVGAGAIAYFAALWLMGFRLADFSRHEPS